MCSRTSFQHARNSLSHLLGQEGLAGVTALVLYVLDKLSLPGGDSSSFALW